MKLFDILGETEAESQRDSKISELSLALEHLTYKNIPGTRNSYRQDSENTNTRAQRHAHVYAKQNGNGKQLYSVNLDGSGHDGSSGVVISSNHAVYLRSLGYQIPQNLTLESLDFAKLNPDEYVICILE